MSDSVLPASATQTAEQSAGGIVCCSGDLCSQVTSAQLPWFRLIVGLFVAAQTMMLGVTINLTAPDDRTTLLLLQGGMLAATLVVLALLGLPLLGEAVRQARQGRVTMELLFLVGIAASLAISVTSTIRGVGPVYFEVVSVLLVVYSIGRLITSHSRSKALLAAQSMLQEVATARLTDGRMMPATDIQCGDRVRVVPGELIPVDGLVVEGSSLIRTTAFSGEWKSSAAHPGQTVLAGAACEDGTLVVEASSHGTDRRIDRLAALITSACQSNSPMQRLADRFVQVFLPLVTLTAVSSLLYWGWAKDWSTGIFIALSVILVACPCAAGLATPLATWTAIGQLANKGLLVKSADALQRLATVESVVFDKTGTLADESLQLKSLVTAPDPQQRERTLALLAEIERHSDHPVARVLRELPDTWNGDRPVVSSVRTLPGQGIEAAVMLGLRPASVRLIRREEADELTIDATLDGTWIATASFTEHLRESSGKAIERLRAIGLPVQVMTGDSSGAVRNVEELAPATGGMTPEQKHIAARAATTSTLFIGDGVNDAAAMGASHCSIAMASGAAITIAAADATLQAEDLTVIPEAIALSRRAVNTIRTNFAWAVAYNVVGMVAAVMGWLHPILASILMSVSSGVVAWRSFNLVGRASATTVRKPAASPAPVHEAGRILPFWLYATLHVVGMVGQGLLIIPMARLNALQSGVLLLVCLAVAGVIIRYANRWPAWADMTLAMLSVGGMGMNLGWWIDLRFGSAMQDGMVALCCVARKTAEGENSHWMYWLMLLVGVPAMFVLRRSPVVFDWRRWCCTGMLLLGVPGMCFGMWAGAQLASGLTDVPPQARVLAAYVLMVAGMCVGMLVPHALELAFPRRLATQLS